MRTLQNVIKNQQDAVDHDMMRENAHSTMTINKPDRQSRVTFGGPRKVRVAQLGEN